MSAAATTVDAAPARGDAGLFGRGRGVLAAVAAGAAAFAAFALLYAFADSWNLGADGGAHALSPAATGFAGIVQLLDAAHPGHDHRPARTRARRDRAPFLVLTPGAGTDGARVLEIVNRRPHGATLIVLSKWMTIPDPEHAGWVRSAGIPTFGAAFPLSPWGSGDRLKLGERDAAKGETLSAPATGQTWPAPRKLQFLRPAPTITPVILDRQGNTILGEIQSNRPLWVLADPDLIDNLALSDASAAARAVAVFEQLPSGASARFDVTLNGFERSPNLLRLALTPPFLPFTLALLAAALLAGWAAAVPFGARAGGEPAHPAGAGALIDNAADLVGRAGREAAFALRYAGIIRDRALRRREPLDRRYFDLETAAANAQRPEEALAAAHALWEWEQGREKR